MNAICDAHKKKVGVELLYNSVHRKFISWRSDAVEKTSTQLSSSGERGKKCGDGHKSGGQYVAVLFGLQLPLTHNTFK